MKELIQIIRSWDGSEIKGLSGYLGLNREEQGRLKAALQASEKLKAANLVVGALERLEAADIVAGALGGIFSSLILGLFGSAATYRDMLEDLARHIGVRAGLQGDSFAIEQKIVNQVIESAVARMDRKQKDRFVASIRRVASELGLEATERLDALRSKTAKQLPVALAGVGRGRVGAYLGSMIAVSSIGMASGFQLVGARAGDIMKACALLGGVFGAIGWMAAGLYSAFKLTGPNYRRMLAAVLYIHMIRSKPKAG